MSSKSSCLFGDSVQNFVNLSIFLTNFDDGNRLDLVIPIFFHELFEYVIYTYWQFPIYGGFYTQVYSA
jgi:hypothetical protein